MSFLVTRLATLSPAPEVPALMCAITFGVRPRSSERYSWFRMSRLSVFRASCWLAPWSLSILLSRFQSSLSIMSKRARAAPRCLT